jgi:hypothetical protein
MSIFGSIMSKIFGGPAHAETAAPAAASPDSSPAVTAATAAAAPSGEPVDVEAILNEHVAKSGQQLDWRRSIVDLMKALGLDSSLSARKELAQELHFSGDMNDSAAMNVWLHAQVMAKLAQNGGKVPDDLKG